MRLSLMALVLASLVGSMAAARAQGGPCTQKAIAQEHLLPGEDAFTFMPAYGKPVVGRRAIGSANKESFGTSANVKQSWRDDHRIVAAAAGDMAYERGTLHMEYDRDGEHVSFDAAMLTVFKAKGDVCEIAAMTMHPLEP